MYIKHTLSVQMLFVGAQIKQYILEKLCYNVFILVIINIPVWQILDCQAAYFPAKILKSKNYITTHW